MLFRSPAPRRPLNAFTGTGTKSPNPWGVCAGAAASGRATASASSCSEAYARRCGVCSAAGLTVRAGGEGPVTSRVKVAAGMGTYHVASAGVGAGWEEGDGLWDDVLGGRLVE